MNPLSTAARALRKAVTSRPDGDLIDNIHPYRRIMPYIMNRRNESVVYFDWQVRAENLLAYIESQRARGNACGVTHLTVAAAVTSFAENPTMNRFIAGNRLYQRNELWLSFSMKRKKRNATSKIAVVKRQFLKDEGPETFDVVCERINGQIRVERTDKKTYMDKELSVLHMLPGPVLRAGVQVLKGVDAMGMLPKSFIDGDGMYTSLFIANLGSLEMDAGFHHLYEWGTCPLFLMVGQVREQPVVEDGEVRVGKVLHLRYSYDERIDDGLTARFGMESMGRILSDPATYLGCLQDDGSDHWDLRLPIDKR